jgi:hypothetical protein
MELILNMIKLHNPELNIYKVSFKNNGCKENIDMYKYYLNINRKNENP